MKKNILFLVFLIMATNALAQKTDPNMGFSIKGVYAHEFLLDGYVHVREWDLEGDKMELDDLGISGYPVLQLELEKQLKKNRLLSISYEKIYVRGKSNFNRDIAYNGTLINGRSGIDVSPTRYSRLSVGYQTPMFSRGPAVLSIKVGFTYDHITFYLDGEVADSSPRSEVYESFGKQALPYPQIGLVMQYDINKGSFLNLEISGSYIPEFKSFFNEGGPMYLHYSNFYGELGYLKSWTSWEILLGVRARSMRIFQESLEDTNDLKIATVAPFMGLGYKF